MRRDKRTEDYTEKDAAQLIAALTAELATLAHKAGLEPLAYVLAMAGLEARNVLSPNEQEAA